MSFLESLLQKQNAARVAAPQQTPEMPVRQRQLPVDPGLAEAMMIDQQYRPYNTDMTNRGLYER